MKCKKFLSQSWHNFGFVSLTLGLKMFTFRCLAVELLHKFNNGETVILAFITTENLYVIRQGEEELSDVLNTIHYGQLVSCSAVPALPAASTSTGAANFWLLGKFNQTITVSSYRNGLQIYNFCLFSLKKFSWRLLVKEPLKNCKLSAKLQKLLRKLVFCIYLGIKDNIGWLLSLLVKLQNGLLSSCAISYSLQNCNMMMSREVCQSKRIWTPTSKLNSFISLLLLITESWLWFIVICLLLLCIPIPIIEYIYVQVL